METILSRLKISKGMRGDTTNEISIAIIDLGKNSNHSYLNQGVSFYDDCNELTYCESQFNFANDTCND